MIRISMCARALAGVLAFRCHRLVFPEYPDGTFGMATALIVAE